MQVRLVSTLGEEKAHRVAHMDAVPIARRRGDNFKINN